MKTSRKVFKKKLSISPFPLVILMSCVIGVILFISEKDKEETLGFIIPGIEIDRDFLEDRVRNNILDGCRFVYLDVGTNIGVQIRKLFEPDLYPNASIHRVFNRYFGDVKQRSIGGICVVGFEPNPSHTSILKKLHRSYKSCGWKLIIFTETAVSDHYGTTEFFSDNDFKHQEWGGSILGPKIMESISRGMSKKRNFKTEYLEDGTKSLNEISPSDSQKLVNVIRLSDFINNVVATRSIPSSPADGAGEGLKQPSVLMKIDIEGSELDVVSDLLLSGCLKHIDLAMIEWHHDIMKDFTRRKKTIWLEDIISRISRFDKLHSLTRPNKKKFEAIRFDDETYYDSNFDLPTCTKKPHH